MSNHSSVRPLCLAATAAILLSSGWAAGDAPTSNVVDFIWDAPAECPSAVSILAEVARISSTTPSTQRWRARATVAHASAGPWTLHLSTEVDGRKDGRDFVAASCAELASAAAVVLAVAVDPALSATPPVAPSPAPLVDARDEADPAPPASRSRGRPFALVGGGAASVGALASPAVGCLWGAAWTPPKARLELDGLWFPTSQVEGSASGAGGSFSLIAAAVLGCWVPVDGRIRLGGCLGMQAGELQARAEGAAVTQSFATRSPWVAGTAGGLLVGRLVEHVGLRAGLDVVVPLVRDQFFVAGVDTVHTPSPVAAQTSLALELQIP